MADRYENIRKALAMEPTPGPWRLSRRDDWHGPIVQRGKQGGFVVQGLSPAAEDADAALIAACDPDTIRALLADRDALAAALEAAREDAERIDWLELHCVNVADEYGTGSQLYFGTYRTGPLRAAIDQERGKENANG